MTDLAAVFHWSVGRTRRFFIANKLAKKLGGLWFVSRTALRDEFPDAYDALIGDTSDESE